MVVLIVIIIIAALVTVVAVVDLLAPSLLDGAPVLHALVVTLPINFGVGWERQDPSHGLTELQASLVLGARPDADDVLPVSHTENDTANLITRLSELVSDNGKEEVLPVAVGNALFQAHNPFPSTLVLIVFPYWPNALLEEVVVRN